MRGKVREDILEYLKAQQYVSSHEALEHTYYGGDFDDEDEKQFEADFDATLLYFLEHVEAIPVPS